MISAFMHQRNCINRSAIVIYHIRSLFGGDFNFAIWLFSFVRQI